MSRTAEEDRIARVQRQADEITDITRSNIQKTIARGDDLDTMDAKAQVLEQQGKTFHGNARALRRKFCMQSYRLAFLIFLILAVIAVIIYFSVRKKKD